MARDVVVRDGVGAFRETPGRMGWQDVASDRMASRSVRATDVDARVGTGASGLVTGRFAKRPYTVPVVLAADSGTGVGSDTGAITPTRPYGLTGCYRARPCRGVS